MRPEHLCASVQKLLALIIPLRNDLHSGATARESHPLPYSSRFDAGHPNAFERAWNQWSRVADGNLSRAEREVKNLRAALFGALPSGTHVE